MRFSLVALVGLAAFAGNFGADARAIPNELTLTKREPAAPAPVPVVPKPPTIPKPPTVPRPGEPGSPGGEPEPVVPDPVTPPGPPKPPTVPKPPVQPKPPVPPGCEKLKRWERLIGRQCTPPTAADPVPSIDDIKPQINNPTGKYLFYSGPGDKPGTGYIQKANDWINKQIRGNNEAKKGYKKLDQSWADPQYPDTYQVNQPPAIASVFNNRASAAFAQKAEGVVYVLLPKDTTGTNWQKDTVWDLYEWPNLGPGVTKVIRVNPEDDTEEVILDRTGGAA